MVYPLRPKLANEAEFWCIEYGKVLSCLILSGHRNLRRQLVDLHSSPPTSWCLYKFYSAESSRSMGHSRVHPGWGFSTDPLIFDSTCLSLICPSQKDFRLCRLKISRETWGRTQGTSEKVPWTLDDKSIELTETTSCRSDTDDESVSSVVNFNWV